MNQRKFWKQLWRLIYPILIFLAISYAVTYASMLILVMKDSMGALQSLPADATYEQVYELANQYSSVEQIKHEQTVYLNYYRIVECITYLCAAPFIFLIYFLDRRKEEKKWHLSQVHSYWYFIPLLGGAAVSLVINSLVNALTSSVPSTATTASVSMTQYLADASQSPLAAFQASLGFRIFALGILEPVVSEMLFRGILYKRSRSFRGVIMSTIWSILFFGVASTSAEGTLYILVLSVACCYVYERYRNLLAPILLHVGASLLAIWMETYSDLLGEVFSGARLLMAIAFGVIMMITCVLIIQSYVNIWREHNETADNNRSGL